VLIIYLNGVYLPYDQARIHPEDRGFLLADGIYEVIRFYGGRPFLQVEHLDRLQRSADAVRLPLPSRDLFSRVIDELLTTNDLLSDDGTIYIQVTRGAYTPRTHWFPAGETEPTLLIIARKSAPMDPALREAGVSAVTLPDNRWDRCDIKSIGLLPNVLAKQAAIDAGAYEAVFVRDGRVTEGSSTNIFGVLNGVIRTHPADNRILCGITRNHALRLAAAQGFEIREEALTREETFRCSELFLTSTTSEVLPITALDGRPVGTGRPGPMTQKLYEAFQDSIAENGAANPAD
jgi:D-alanine transaminase